MKRIERPKIDPHILRQLTKVQRQISGERIILLKNGAETIEYLHIKKKKKELWSISMLYIKVCSAWIIDLNVKLEL